MTKNQGKFFTVRKKLAAAVAMLLVASIMVISSTYAWFTLSTAPEVTGIKTSVGANGNLEIALRTGALAGIDTITDGASKSPTELNATWGNLVDLSSVAYGLDKIVLKPAALNLVEGSDGKKIGSIILKTPTYGSDGRVSELSANTVTGTFNNSASIFQIDNKYGVRALGTASTMTVRQLNYLNALSNLAAGIETATGNASASLRNNGSALASVVIGAATGESIFKADDLDALDAMITSLTAANESAGNAIKQAVLAELLSSLNNNFDSVAGEDENAKVKTITDAVNAATITDGTLNIAGVAYTPSSTITDALASYAASATALTSAKTALDAIDRDAPDAAAVKGVLNYLVDTSKVTVNGSTISEFKDSITNEDGSYDLSGILGGITVAMTTGGGVYANLADMCGAYSVVVNGINVSYNGINASGLSATIAVNTTVAPAYLVAAAAAVVNKKPDSAEAADGDNITDTYAYAIDLAFRTNAAGSNLLLQTTPEQRIYSDSTNAATQGQGSYMEFTSTDVANFTTAQMKNLMGAIRILFIEENADATTGYTILAEGALDLDNATVEEAAGKVKALLYIAGAEEEVLGKDAYTIIADGTGTDDAYATLNSDETGATKISKAAYEALADRTTTTKTLLEGDNAVICALNQSTPKGVTALVYLDGEVVDNSMVANAMTSMTGTMNLQFASSATLVPMENSELKNGN